MISSSLWFELLVPWDTLGAGSQGGLSWEKCRPRAKDCRWVTAGAGFKGGSVSPLSLVHLSPQAAERVVGRLWSGE